MTAYDPSNIFAKILKGEIPSHKIYEDADTFAFMDIMPQGEGHSLVIPKAAGRNLFDIEDTALAAAIRTTKLIANAAMEAFSADGVTIIQANEAAGGQTVFHLHFHVIPRYQGTPLKFHAGEMAKPEVLTANAEKLRKVLGTAG